MGPGLQVRFAGWDHGTAGSPGHGGLRAGLLVAQVALSIVLLTGAGLMMRSFLALTHIDAGFDPYSVLYIPA